MKNTDRDALYTVLLLTVLVLLDLAIIGGILVKGHANFPELIKNLKS